MIRLLMLSLLIGMSQFSCKGKNQSADLMNAGSIAKWQEDLTEPKPNPQVKPEPDTGNNSNGCKTAPDRKLEYLADGTLQIATLEPSSLTAEFSFLNSKEIKFNVDKMHVAGELVTQKIETRSAKIINCETLEALVFVVIPKDLVNKKMPDMLQDDLGALITIHGGLSKDFKTFESNEIIFELETDNATLKALEKSIKASLTATLSE